MTQDNWIKVEDRLPEHHDRVVVCVDGNIGTGYYHTYYNYWRWDTKNPVTATVTHWQPLPEPPKI